jgi:hypothetical protein
MAEVSLCACICSIARHCKGCRQDVQAVFVGCELVECLSAVCPKLGSSPNG